MAAPAAFIGRTTLDVLYLLDSLPAEDTNAFARAFRAASEIATRFRQDVGIDCWATTEPKP